MINIITIYDIPVELKEYHDICFDAETNEYILYGHDGIQFINIPACARLWIFDSNPDIIHVDFIFGSLTIYPLGTHFTIYR